MWSGLAKCFFIFVVMFFVCPGLVDIFFLCVFFPCPPVLDCFLLFDLFFQLFLAIFLGYFLLFVFRLFGFCFLLFVCSFGFIW